MYVVIVEFHIKPAHWQEFLPAMIDNAQVSLRDEPGCHHFDVDTSDAEPHVVFLYELYRDKAAFDEHLKAPHFISFAQKTAPMVEKKSVRIFNRVAG
jgi:(4S)-4-hydroxy-5-phosphonooxypentane-2,3-dione isomerase